MGGIYQPIDTENEMEDEHWPKGLRIEQIGKPTGQIGSRKWHTVLKRTANNQFKRASTPGQSP